MSPSTSSTSCVRILTEFELRQCVSLDLGCLQTIDDAFSWLARRPVAMPPIQHISVTGSEPTAEALHHVGDVDIKSAFVPGLDRFAVKIASGFFGNAALGLPSGSGLMVVLDATTGFCKAVLLDNGFLTDLRTALAGGVAAKHLAPERVAVAGVVGTGRQAELQAKALYLVRPFDRLLIHGRTRSHALQLVERLGQDLPEVSVEVVASVEAMMDESQCVVTTTPATTALIDADWLRPGTHITAMGSDLPGKRELDPKILVDADLYVCDRRSQCERLGELQHVAQAQRDELKVIELGDITSGQKSGRTAQDQVTVCDLTGTGVQDTAIAVHALAVAEQRDLGRLIETG